MDESSMNGGQRSVAMVGDATSTLAEVVARLAGLAGLAMVVAADATSLARAWRTCAAIVVDPAATAWLPGGLARRDGVVVIAEAPDDGDALRLGLRLGASEVFALAADDDALLRWLALRAEPATAPGQVVAVVGACGGAGASTFAGALAVVGARDGPVTLVDGDRLGGGLDLLLGAEQVEGRRWPQLSASRGLVPADALRASLPQIDGVAVLSWTAAVAAPDPEPEVVEAVVAAAARGSDLVVVDLARSPGAMLAARPDVLVVVVPAAVRAVVGASSVIETCAPPGGDIRLVVRHPGPADIPVDAVSARLGAPVLAVLGGDPRIAAASDCGQFVRALRRSPIGAAAQQALAALRGDRLAAIA